MKSKAMFKTSVLTVIVLFGFALIPGVAWAMLNPAGEELREHTEDLKAIAVSHMNQVAKLSAEITQMQLDATFLKVYMIIT
jgi:hypothetical protein